MARRHSLLFWESGGNSEDSLENQTLTEAGLFNNNLRGGSPGWLSRLSIRLQLRSLSYGSWVRAPRQALCWQFRAWSPLWILCLPLCLPLHSSLSLSQKQISMKEIKKKHTNTTSEDEMWENINLCIYIFPYEWKTSLQKQSKLPHLGIN